MRRDAERIADGPHVVDRNFAGSTPRHAHRGAIDARDFCELGSAPGALNQRLQIHGERVPQAPTPVKTLVVPPAPHDFAPGVTISSMTEFRGDPVLGAKLRELREARGEDIIDLAVAVGVSRSHIGQVEKGRKPVSLKTLKEIAKHYDKKIDYFINPPRVAGQHDEKQELIEEFVISASGMTTQAVRAVVEVARAIRGAPSPEPEPMTTSEIPRSKKGAR